MPRTDLTKSNALGPYAVYSGVLARLTMTVADVGNKNSAVFNDKDLLVAYNSGASPYTVTITSFADPKYGRSGDITTYSIPVGEFAVFGPFVAPGWMQTDGKLYFEGSNAAVKFGIVTQPAM